MSVRLQKFMADAGVASRRASEAMIQAGQVLVNGQVVSVLGVNIDPAHDRVMVDGKEVHFRRKIYIALHKPRGCVCSRKDPENRPCLHDYLPAEWHHIYSVGRLDWDSEGLIFLTNDGDFCLKLTHPRYQVRKIYQAQVQGCVEPHHIQKLTEGVLVEGDTLQASRAKVLDTNSTHSLVEIELKEGRNREVRRMFESQGLIVDRLIRIQIGPIKLGQLPEGKWRTLTETEIKSLLKAV
jgi:pseudouridine synthase